MIAKKKGRRANGEGSVFHSKATDRWYAVISVGAGKRRKLTARTRAEVVERLREVQRQNADGMVVTLPPTLAELAEEWLTRRAAVRKAPSTFSRLEYLVRRKIVPQFGAIRVDKLSVADVEGWLDAEAARGLARRTLDGYRATLAEILEWGRTRLRVLPFNVARVAELPVDARPPRERRTLSEAEAGALLSALGHEYRWRAYFTIMLLLGLRPGEADALGWSAIDHEAQTVSIHTSLQRASGGQPICLGPTETRQTRVLHPSRPAIDALRRQRVQQDHDRIVAGRLWSDAWSGLVFLTEVGTPYQPSNARKAFARICDRAGVPRITPYELRHSAASLLVAAGVPPLEVADLLGHADTRMLERYYRHRLQPVVTAGPVALAALVPETTAARPSEREVDSSSQPKPG